MNDWNYNRDNILEIKFENLLNNYDDMFRIIFEYIGFSKSEVAIGLNVAAKYDLGRKSLEEIEKMKHVSSQKTTKWKEYFGVQHKEMFIKKFGNILVKLGYETNNNW